MPHDAHADALHRKASPAQPTRQHPQTGSTTPSAMCCRKTGLIHLLGIRITMLSMRTVHSSTSSIFGTCAAVDVHITLLELESHQCERERQVTQLSPHPHQQQQQQLVQSRSTHAIDADLAIANETLHNPPLGPVPSQVHRSLKIAAPMESGNRGLPCLKSRSNTRHRHQQEMSSSREGDFSNHVPSNPQMSRTMTSKACPTTLDPLQQPIPASCSLI